MLAGLADLVALGAVPKGWTPSSPEATRATRLLEMAQAQALDFLGVSEVDVLAWSSAERRTRLIVWIAEKASTRVTTSAAPSADQFEGAAGPRSMMLNRWEKAELRSIGRMTGIGTLSVDRGYSDLTSRVATDFIIGVDSEDVDELLGS